MVKDVKAGTHYRIDKIIEKAIDKKIKDAKLMNMLNYITDYMRQVMESGQRFGSNHFFILLLQFSPEDLQNNAEDFIQILINQLKIKREEFNTFVDGLLDDDLSTAYKKMLEEGYFRFD